MRSDVTSVFDVVGGGRGLRHGACDVHWVDSPSAAELYVTATPAGDGTVRDQAREVYARVAGVLRNAGAAVVGERVFVSSDGVGPAAAARAGAYGELDDSVRPTVLLTRGAGSGILGVQVHAVCGVGRPAVVSGGGGAVARVFACNGYQYLSASGLRAPQLAGGGPQTRAAFEQAEALLAGAGGSLADIARTWIWMDEVLAWYPELNRVRNGFFTERGIMGVPGRMPASTGIGVSPAGARVAIDVFAAWGKPGAVERFHALGNQRSAYEYGSAFARAARVRTPGGSTVFCSGTAAIDERGNTCFVDDAAGQVGMTVENVTAVLRDMHCGHEDVVQAMAYCATEEARACWEEDYDLPWPCLTMMGDVCRGDLLFEVEVTACVGARRG